MKHNIKPLIVCFICLVLCFSVFFGIKAFFFGDLSILDPIKNISGESDMKASESYIEAVTKAVATEQTTTKVVVEVNGITDDDVYIYEGEDTGNYAYSIAPTFEDDGSIIFDGKTLTELTNQLNKSLKSNLTNTGYFFADYTRRTGMDPYLAVAISLEETGCSSVNGCASWAVSRNNWGGMIGCNFDTFDDGLNAYLNNLYNGYWSKGLTTPELVANKYNPANAFNYGQKIRRWMDVIKNK